MRLFRPIILPVLAPIILLGVTSFTSPCLSKPVPKTRTLTTPSGAQLKELEKLFAIIGMDKSIDRSWQGLVRTIRGQLIRRKVQEYSKQKTLSRKEVFDKAMVDTDAVLKRFSAGFEKEYKSNMLKIYRHVYAKYYTAADMKALISFYNSEAGQKAQANDSKIVKRSMIKLIKKLRPEVEELLAQRLQTMLGEEGSGAAGGRDVVDEILE